MGSCFGAEWWHDLVSIQVSISLAAMGADCDGGKGGCKELFAIASPGNCGLD